MPKVHLSAHGPARCTATKRACPVGGEHFEGEKAWSEAAKRFEESMGEQSPKALTKGVARKRTPEEQLGAMNISRFIKKNVDNGYSSVLRGETLNEVIENLKKDKEFLLKSDRMTEKEYNRELDDYANENNPSLLSSTSIQAHYHPSKDYKNSIEVTVNSEDIEFSNNDVFYSKFGEGEVIEKYDDYPNKVVTRTYEIPEEDLEKLHNQHKYEQVKRLNEVIDNPNLPDWGVLPAQIDSKTKDTNLPINRFDLNTRAVKIDYDVRRAHDDLSRYEKAYERYSKKKQEVEGLQSEHKDLTDAMKKMGKSPADVRALASMDKENKELEEKILKSSKTLETYRKSGGDEDKLNRLRAAAKHNDEVLAKFNETANQAKKQAFINDIAKRYPSDNVDTRIEKANEWLKDHPDSWTGYKNELR